jgi:hypothetical protein
LSVSFPVSRAKILDLGGTGAQQDTIQPRWRCALPGEFRALRLGVEGFETRRKSCACHRFVPEADCKLDALIENVLVIYRQGLAPPQDGK